MEKFVEVRPIDNESELPKQEPLAKIESFTLSLGRLLIVDKVNKPLRATLDESNDYSTLLTKIPKKLQGYPNPWEEKVRLATHQKLIRDTQKFLEGPPHAVKRGPISTHSDLEMTNEVASTQERDESLRIPKSHNKIKILTLEGIQKANK